MKTGRLFAVAALLLSAACGSDSTAPVAPYAGTYTLALVGGVEPPAALTVNGVDLVVHAATFTLTNSTYSQAATFEDANGIVPVTDHGAINGDATGFTFVSSEGAETTTGTWASDTLRVIDGGYLWIYTK